MTAPGGTPEADRGAPTRPAPHREAPLDPLPPDSWDCHAHVIGDRDRYPLSLGRGYDPPDAPLEDYLAHLDRLGVAHGVLVQPSVYGFDNRCLLDALDRAQGRLRGVVVPSANSPSRTLDAMHARGVRGVRCNLLNPGGLEPSAVLGWQPALRELGWHVAFQIDVEQVGDLEAFVERFDIPVVIDHMGRPHAAHPTREHSPGGEPPSGGSDSFPGFSSLVETVRAGACYVKLSAPYRLTEEGPPWSGVARLAKTLLEANPAACLWATDWPHTDTAARIDPADLVRALVNWCPDRDDRARILVGNPRRLLDGNLPEVATRSPPPATSLKSRRDPRLRRPP